MARDTRPYWQAFFTDRQIAEIDFDRLYFEHLDHQLDAHAMRLIIAKMAELLDAYGPRDGCDHTNRMKELHHAE